MRVRVRLFASLREAAGEGEVDLELPAGATAEDAWDALARRHPALAARRARLTAAVNRRYVAFAETLQPGDEVVFVPPVSGG
jgi:molybdopterin synthase sulfur carrier subunit